MALSIDAFGIFDGDEDGVVPKIETKINVMGFVDKVVMIIWTVSLLINEKDGRRVGLVVFEQTKLGLVPGLNNPFSRLCIVRSK